MYFKFHLRVIICISAPCPSIDEVRNTAQCREADKEFVATVIMNENFQ